VNDGKGHFTIAPISMAAGLSHIGMVTDAAWTDTNRDGWPDLVIAGEWMPVTVYINNNGKLENRTAEKGLSNTSGLWQSIQAVDIDDNGFPDLLVGNWGENSKLKASEQEPLELFVGDVDDNGATDQIMGSAKDGNYYPFANKEELEKQLPFIRKSYESYAQMAGLTVNAIFGERLKPMNKLTATTLSTCLLRNTGNKYTIERMPDAIQRFPVFAWWVADFNRDGKKDILAAGNFYGVSPYEGRYDAGYGQVLINKNSTWATPSPLELGLMLSGEVRSIRQLRTANNQWLLLVARNNDSLIIIKPTGK
jgi:hypothetical protein